MRKHNPFKLSITQHTTLSVSDTGPETFVISTGWQRKQHFLSFSTCHLCSQKAHSREGGGQRMPPQQPGHTTAKSNRTRRSNFSPLSLGIVPFGQVFFIHHNKVLCSSLAGFFTKAQQGQGEHVSEPETHQRQEPHWRGRALLQQPSVNMLFPSTSQSSKKGHMVDSSPSMFFVNLLFAAHQQVSVPSCTRFAVYSLCASLPNKAHFFPHIWVSFFPEMTSKVH